MKIIVHMLSKKHLVLDLGTEPLDPERIVEIIKGGLSEPNGILTLDSTKTRKIIPVGSIEYVELVL